MKLSFILAIILFFFTGNSAPCPFHSNQNSSYGESVSFKEIEDSLRKLAPLVLKGENDSIRKSANTLFFELFQSALLRKGSFQYRFDSLSTVSIQIPPDKSFRIINWVVILDNGMTHQYFGFIQTQNLKSKQEKLIPLIDQTPEIELLEKTKLSPEKWFGAIYYNIIETKWKGKKYYTLLGWKGNNLRTTKKVIEILTFSGSKPVFGAPLFPEKKGKRSRIVFEYNALAVMSLKYDSKKKLIIHDHLSPSHPSQKGNFESYGPDFTYQALRFRKGLWITKDQFDARNEKKPGDRKPPKIKHQPGLLPPQKE